MKKFMSVLLATGVITSAFVFAACNNTNDGDNQKQESSVASSTPSSVKNETQTSEKSVAEISVNDSVPAITSQQLSELTNTISEYQEVPEFKSKSEVINAKSITEKAKITIVPDNSGKTYTSLVLGQIENAANAAGFNKVDIKETDGTPSSLSDALNSSIKQKSNISVIFGDVNKDNIVTAIETVQANGIEVVSSGCAGVKQNDHFVDNTMPVNYQLAGKLMADWTLVKNNGKVNALAVNNADSVLSNTLYSGFADEFKKYVSTATGYCTTVNGSSTEVGNGFSSKIKKALQDDANIDYIIVFDDSMISDAVSAVEQSNSKAKIISSGGSKEAFDMVQSGNIEMLVAHSYEWIGYATVDYALRVMSGSKLPDEQDVPFRIVTSDIIKKELENDETDSDGFYQICFGAAFVDGYSHLWGLDE